MAALRADPPKELAGRAVTGVEDLLEGRRFVPADVLIWELDGGRAVVRPSGTEAKVKSYAEAVEPVPEDSDLAPVRAEARARVDAVLDAVDALLGAHLDGPGR
jgi:phosphomannomutase